jgi:hypothetical protein
MKPKKLRVAIAAVVGAAAAGQAGCMSLTRTDGAACEAQAYEISIMTTFLGWRPYLTRLDLNGAAASPEDFDLVARSVRKFESPPERRFTCAPDPRLELAGRSRGMPLTLSFTIDGSDIRPLFDEENP